MRYLVLASVLIAAAVSVVAVPSSDADYDQVAFSVDGVYYIIDELGAYVCSYDAEVPEPNLVIPESVSYQGTSYTVVGITSSGIFTTGVITVTLPSTIVDYKIAAVTSPTVTAINVASSKYVSEDGVVYDKDKFTLVQYPRGKTDEVLDVADTVKVIEDSSVAANPFIQTVNLPTTVLSIGDYAFEECTSLAHINSRYEDALPDMTVVIGSYAFSGCSALKSLVFDYSLKSIGDGAFSSSGLEEVSLPYALSALGSAVFSDCTSLKYITGGSSIFIDFDGVLYESRENYKSLVCYPAGREGDSFVIPEETTSISDSAFDGCLYLKNVELPSKMTEVPAFSFGGCTSLEHVKMSDAVMSIGMFAFVDCVNLRDVTIPAKVGAIGMYAFSGTALTSVTIPSSVSFLDMGAFSKCPSLKTALFEDGEILLDSNIFLDSAALETVEFEGKSVTFSEYSLSVGIGPEPKDLTVIVPKGLSVPDNVSDEFTNISIEVLGERPYPYVNLIGVAICIVILFLIVYSVREV